MAASSSSFEARIQSLGYRSDSLYPALIRKSALSGLTFPELLLRPEEGRSLRSYRTGALSAKSPLFSELNRLINGLEEGDGVREVYDAYIRKVCAASEGKLRWKLLKGEVYLIAYLNSQTVCLLIPRKLSRAMISIRSSASSSGARLDQPDLFIPIKLENLFERGAGLLNERRISRIFKADHESVAGEEGAASIRLLTIPEESLQSSIEALFAISDPAKQKQLFPFFSEFTHLKLSGLKIEGDELIAWLQRVTHLEELTICASEQLSIETLLMLFNQFPKLRLKISESPGLLAKPLASLIELAWERGRSLSFLIGDQSYPLTPDALDRPFREAILSACPEFARALALKGATLDLPELLKAVVEKNSPQSLFLIADLGLQLDQPVEGETLFHLAAKANRAELIRALFHLESKRWDEKIKIVNNPGLMSRTPLHMAALHGNLEAVQALLENGADPLLVDDYQETPLALALKSGVDEVVRLLMAPPLFSDPEPFQAGTPLHQLLSFEKLSHTYLEKGEYRSASLTLASAFSIAKHHLPSYLPLLDRQLDRIEASYLFKTFHRLSRPSRSSKIGRYRAILEELRSKAAQEVERGESIRVVQKRFSEGEKRLLIELFQESLESFGSPPGGYALIALDELSRNEIFPFSNCRFAIFVKNRHAIDFFRGVAKLLELKLVALGISDCGEGGATALETGSFFDSSDFTLIATQSVPVGTASEIKAMIPKFSHYSLISVGGALSSFFRIAFFKKKELILKGRQEKRDQAIHELKSALKEWKKIQTRLTPDRREFELENDLYYPLQKILRSLILYFEKEGASTHEGIKSLPFRIQSKKEVSRLFDRLSLLVMRAQLFRLEGESIEVDSQEKREIHRSIDTLYQVVARFVDSRDVKLLQSLRLSDRQEERPFHLAIERGEIDKVHSYLEAGESIDRVNLDGYNPLHIAASMGNLEILRLLLDSSGGEGALVSRAPRGETALHLAAQRGHLECATLLLQRGGVLIPDQKGRTPFDIAVENEDDPMISLFLFFEREGLSFIPQRLLDSTSSSSSTLPALPGKLSEKEAEDLFSSAVERRDLRGQIFYLLHLSLFLLKRGEYRKAALTLNSGYALAQESSLPDRCRELLLSQIERVEKQFIQHEVGRAVKGPSRLSRYRMELKRIREGVADSLESGQPINEIVKELTRSYKGLLCDLLTDSIEALGKEPPTQFAMAGLGSMSRDEMCPYSDVEFIFLVEEESGESRAYFRSLARLMMFKILNLGETEFKLIREVSSDGEGLERSMTPSGFSMDSGLSPLGTSELYEEGLHELIGTPKRLAQFQAESGGAEIILVNAMRTACWIAGDQELVRGYEEEVRAVLDAKVCSSSSDSAPPRLRERRALELMRGFVDEFKPKLDEDKIDLRGFDVKKELYRLPQTVISGLALYYGLRSTNTFDQIDELEQAGLIPTDGAAWLKKTLRSIFKLRVQAHLFYKTECEVLYHDQGKGAFEDKGLLAISPDLCRNLGAIHRVLVPLHQQTSLFLAEDKGAFQDFHFFDPFVGVYDDSLRKDGLYDQALASAISSVALKPAGSTLKELAHVQSNMGQSKQAVKSFKESLRLLRSEHNDQPHFEVFSALSNLGVAYSKLGKNRRAIGYYERSLAMSKQLYGNLPRPEFANILSCLGITYSALGEDAQALKCYEESLKIRRSFYGDLPHPEVAVSLSDLGFTYGKLGEIRPAIDYCEQSLAMRKLLHDDLPCSDVPCILGFLGHAYFALSEHAQAVVYYEQSLTMRKQLYESLPRPELANILSYLGHAYFALSEHTQAVVYYEQSLAMRKQLYENLPCPEFANILSCLGHAYFALSEHVQAVAYYEQSLAMKKELYGDRSHPDVAENLNLLGQAYHQISNYRQALDHYKFSLEMYKEIHDNKSHSEVVNVLICLSDAYNKLDEFGRGIDCCKLALSMQKEIASDDSPSETAAIILNNFGDAYSGLGESGQAIKHYNSALSMYKEVHADQSYIAEVLIGLGNVCKNLNDLEKAIAYYDQSFAIYAQIYGEKPHSNIALVLLRFGEAYQKRGELSKAIEYYNNAHDMFVETVGVDHPSTKKAEEALTTLAEAFLA